MKFIDIFCICLIISVVTYFITYKKNNKMSKVLCCISDNGIYLSALLIFMYYFNVPFLLILSYVFVVLLIILITAFVFKKDFNFIKLVHGLVFLILVFKYLI